MKRLYLVMAALVAVCSGVHAQSVKFYDTFETNGLANWTVTVTTNFGLLNGALTNVVPVGGTNSAKMTNSANRMHRNIIADNGGSEVTGPSLVSWYIYDDMGTATRAFNEIRGYVSGTGLPNGSTTASGTLGQSLAAGKYSSVTRSNEVYASNKYQGRVLYPSGSTNTGWFNLNDPGTPVRSRGWHRFDIVRVDSGSVSNKIKFYVDGILGRTIPDADVETWDTLVMGPGLGTTAGTAWYDGVKVEALVAPTINTQPADLTVGSGSNALFTVTATATTSLTNRLNYQWRFNGTNITGATNSSYTQASAQQANNGNYSVVITDFYGARTRTSSNAVLTVIDTPPAIVTSPLSRTNLAGTSVSFSVNASGADPKTYIWLFNGDPILNAPSTNNYTRTNVQQVTAGGYSVIVSNASGAVTSEVANLIVTDAAPVITAQPAANRNVNAGSVVLFGVVTTGSDPRYYQWRKNGGNIAGATNATYTLTNAQTLNGGTYSVTISNALGNVTSDNSILAVNNLSPTITTGPKTQGVLAGSNVVFSVISTGTDPRHYQWKYFGTDIDGATGSTYTVLNAQSANEGNYAVGITNAYGGVISTNAVLTVTNTAPIVTKQPVSRTVNAGVNVTFSSAALGTEFKGYQWRLNGNDIPGATVSTLTVTNAQQFDAGNYALFVYNGYGDDLSLEATLTVVDVAPVIVTQPASTPGSVGSCTTFKVVASGTTPFAYQWYFRGSPISGANESTYLVSNIQLENAGDYLVEVTNPLGTAPSDSAILSVVAEPIIEAITGGGTPNVTVYWHAIAGRTYHLQFANNINDAEWIDVDAEVVASDCSASLPDNNPGLEQRYYRVVLLP